MKKGIFNIMILHLFVLVIMLFDNSFFKIIIVSLYILLIPGYLILKYISDLSYKLDIYEQIILSFGLSISFLMIFGLIINELATNAYKYAFPEKKEGNIEVSLTKQPKNSLLLSITDNGIGLPKRIDIQNTNTLGLRLVNLLVKQLKAKIDHERKNGTKIMLSIADKNVFKLIDLAEEFK